jgi:hypothetical protein
MQCLIYMVTFHLITDLGWSAPRAAVADAAATTATNGPAGGTLVVGRVSNNPRKDSAALKALADYLAASVYGAGVGDAQAKFADDSYYYPARYRQGRKGRCDDGREAP